MTNIDILGMAIMVLFIAMGPVGFVFGVHSYTTLEKHSKRIEELEKRLKKM